MEKRELFSRSKIGVVIFSTTLIKGIAHDTILFIFNVTSCPKYYPDLNKSLAVEVNPFQQAAEQMNSLPDENSIKRDMRTEKLCTSKKGFFLSVGTESVRKAVVFIESIKNNYHYES